MPAAMPTATAIRASRASRSSSRPRKEPKPALMWAAGPSRPPDPPDPIVTAEATILTSGTRPRIPRGPWWNAAIAASVPWPSASGAKRKTMTPEMRPPSATTNGSAQARAKPVMGRPPSPAGDGGVYPPRKPRKNWVASSSAV